MMGESALHVGVDVGGTTVVAAAVADDGTVSLVREAPTPRPSQGAAALERALAEAVWAVCGDTAPASVGIAAAAFVDSDRRHAQFAPHLAWRGEAVADRMEALLGVPVLIENDATCAAWGEASLGAARHRRSSITLTVGTGIGGGIVLDGHLVRGAQGMAGEFGHMCVDPRGPQCPCGGRGCWERYCSGPALLAVAASRFERGGGAGQAPADGADVSRAAEAGQEWAVAAFEEVGTALGRGLVWLVNAIDPEIVVIGGGVSRAGDLLLAPARRVLATDVVGAGHRRVPDVIAAGLGPHAGLVGASLLARTTG